MTLPLPNVCAHINFPLILLAWQQLVSDLNVTENLLFLLNDFLHQERNYPNITNYSEKNKSFETAQLTVAFTLETDTEVNANTYFCNFLEQRVVECDLIHIKSVPTPSFT